MTSIMNRPDIPEILPTRHARPDRLRAFLDGLRHVDRPWSVGIDALLCLAIFGFLAFEGWEYSQDLEWEHMAAVIAAALILWLHSFRAFTTDREDQR